MLSAMQTEKIDETQDLPVMLSDAAWHSILPFIKAFRNVYVGNPETCRRFLSETLVWITKQGATWRALPKAYGYWNTIYQRFGRWCDAGSLKNSMNISMMPVKSLRSSLIQRSCVHMPPQQVPRKKSGGQATQALGRSHGGFTTKLNAAVSDTFLPLRFILTAGACYDVSQAPALIAGYTCAAVIANTAYDSDAFRAKIVAQGGVAVIRPRKNRLEH